MSGDETISLRNVLAEMKKQETAIPLPEAKSDVADLKAYFKKMVPDYDEEKVHLSDMKKMVKWYHLLKTHDAIPTEESKEETPNDATAEQKETPAAE